jgi:hypothetical protein
MTTKTGRHDIAEILLKVALNTKNQTNQIKSIIKVVFPFVYDIVLLLTYMGDGGVRCPQQLVRKVSTLDVIMSTWVTEEYDVHNNFLGR